MLCPRIRKLLNAIRQKGHPISLSENKTWATAASLLVLYIAHYCTIYSSLWLHLLLCSQTSRLGLQLVSANTGLSLLFFNPPDNVCVMTSMAYLYSLTWLTLHCSGRGSCHHTTHRHTVGLQIKRHNPQFKVQRLGGQRAGILMWMKRFQKTAVSWKQKWATTTQRDRQTNLPTVTSITLKCRMNGWMGVISYLLITERGSRLSLWRCCQERREIESTEKFWDLAADHIWLRFNQSEGCIQSLGRKCNPWN